MLQLSGQIPGTAPEFVASSRTLKKQGYKKKDVKKTYEKYYELTPNKIPFEKQEEEKLKEVCIFSDLQRKYNSQMDLRRFVRIKIFCLLLALFKKLHCMDLESLLEFCCSKEGVSYIISRGNPEKLNYYQSCPLCHSIDHNPLYVDEGQPVVGFLTRHSKYYYQ